MKKGNITDSEMNNKDVVNQPAGDIENAINVEKDNLINQVVQARKQRGMTQRELGDQCGIPQPVVARFESGKASPQLETFLRVLIPLNAKVKLSMDDDALYKCPVCGLGIVPGEKSVMHTVRHAHAMEMIKRYGIYLKHDERELLKKLAYKLRYDKHLEIRILGTELLFFSWYMRAAQSYPYKSMKRFPPFEDYIAMLLNCIMPGQKYPLDWMYTFGDDGYQKPDTELVEALIARYGVKKGLPNGSTNFIAYW